MSFGRHAYRHVIQPSPTPFIDHVWISEELLASTFRRFANSQRRYESRVPGPLEARKRLARRRNTALAGLAGSGPLDDIACLFGRNGREHMKWNDGGNNTLSESLDAFPRPSSHSTGPVPFFYDENPNSIGFDKPLAWPDARDGTDKVARDKYIGEQLRKHRTMRDLKQAIRQFNVDLQREPAYSRLIFDHLLAGSAGEKTAVEEIALFLEDPLLNICGAGNYLGAVEHHISRGICLTKQRAPLDAFIRALELGLVPSDEICAIIKALSKFSVRSRGAGKQSGKPLTRFYREMWDAIGRCDVYDYKDLDKTTVDTWLGVLLDKGLMNDLHLAKEIILATDASLSTKREWTPKFIINWLEAHQGLQSKLDEQYADGILNPESVLRITELLVLNKRTQLLETWQTCLTGLQDATLMGSSDVWTDLQQPTGTSTSGLPLQHQIILRLWNLRVLGSHVPARSHPRRGPRETDPTILSLFNLYDSKRTDTREDFMSSLMKGIHELGIPFNGLLMLAVDLRAGKSMTKTARQTLQKFESSPPSFSDIFTDLHAYNAAVPHFFSNFEKMVRDIDITSSTFVEHAINLARTGDSKTVWTLIRLLRSHTPLKIALAKSWQSIPDPSAKALVRYYPEPRTAACPDPHASLEMINLLAIAFAYSKQLSPRRSFELVRWLYVFLYKHNAPVQPALVRALYHAGVVRFRRDGLRVAPTQYAYICAIVKDAEGPEVVKALMDNTLQVGQRYEDPADRGGRPLKC
ncbi:hypothetical protein AOCH_002152 [Aspergillus ochraceoroseus]|nr:hypothetical protein AOCH_002152 [Aspergillus ochraceoroseus]